MKEKSEKSNWTRRLGNLIRPPLHHDGGTPSPSTRRSLVPVEGYSLGRIVISSSHLHLLVHYAAFLLVFNFAHLAR